jgi:hypothetical protein
MIQQGLEAFQAHYYFKALPSKTQCHNPNDNYLSNNIIKTTILILLYSPFNSVISLVLHISNYHALT